MGSSLGRFTRIPPYVFSYEDDDEDEDTARRLTDLSDLPPECAISVLGHLNATDLSLAGCVWQEYASDEILWAGLCRKEWSRVSVYEDRNPSVLSARKLYLLLDEGTLTFNSDCQKGMEYFFSRGLLRNNPEDIALFFDGSSNLSKREMKLFLQTRSDVTEKLVSLQNFSSQSLPNALRKFFAKVEAPDDRGRYLHQLLDTFSKRFCQCNPKLGYSVDFVYVTCFSLILLSVDLTSPHVKNKMSKREFIKNTRNAVGPNQPKSPADEVFGEMYDNVFLRGHVSGGYSGTGDTQIHNSHKMQFIPGTLALFL